MDDGLNALWIKLFLFSKNNKSRGPSSSNEKCPDGHSSASLLSPLSPQTLRLTPLTSALLRALMMLYSV